MIFAGVEFGDLARGTRIITPTNADAASNPALDRDGLRERTAMGWLITRHERWRRGPRRYEKLATNDRTVPKFATIRPLL